MVEEIIEKLNNDEVGILPTDTLYGLVGRALSKKAFERIFELKNRKDKSPFIILISSIEDLKLFGIKLDEEMKDILNEYWPGKVSIIFPCKDEKFSYLHLGTKTLAFRMPNERNLLEILNKTGPLLAPSANVSGKNPVLTIEDAKKYFGDKVDFYLDGGITKSLPSTLIQIENGSINILRKGAVSILQEELTKK